MNKAKAEAYAAALALPGDGNFTLKMLDDAGEVDLVSYSCTIDPPGAPVVWVANRRRDGGTWLVSFSFRDHYAAFRSDPWAKRYEIEALDRRRGTSDIYRFMGIERVWLPTETGSIKFRVQTMRDVFREFEIVPWVAPPSRLFTLAAEALRKTDPLTI
jgi:hypothetical protein